MKFIKVVWAAGLILLSQAVAAQGITGVVTGENGEPLPSAKIFVHEVMRGVLADTLGNYKIEGIKPGTYTVQYSFVGHGSEVKTVTVLKEGLVVLNVQLEEEVVEGHDVVISSAYPGAQDENPVQVVQVSGKQIEGLGEANLMTALANVPGVYQVGTGIGIGKPVIRGLSFNRVVVYSQGIRLENQQWGDEHGLGLMGMGIEKVEIIKSPSSLLYGSDAMGGVMQVIDERPAEIGVTKGDVGLKFFSNTQGFAGDAGLKSSGQKFRAGIRVGGNSHADYVQGDGNRVYHSRFQNFGAKAFFGISLPWVTSTFRANWIESKVGIPDHVSLTNTSQRDFSGGAYQSLKTRLFSNQSVFYVGNHKAKLNIGYTYNDRVEHHYHGVDSSGNFFEGVEPDKGLDMLATSTMFDGKWYFPKLGRFEFLAGTQGMFQVNENFGAEMLVPDSRIFDLGILGMAKAHWDRVDLQMGLRFDRRMLMADDLGRSGRPGYRPAFDRAFSSFNGAIGGVFHLNESILMRTNLASGFRAPNLAELASNGSHAGTNRYEIGDPDLRSEQNVQLDIGMHLHTEHVSFDLSLYNNFIARFIYAIPLDSTIDGDPVFQYVQEDADLFGGEAFVDLHPHPVDWLHLESGIALVVGQTLSGEFLPRIPAVRWNTNLRAELEDKGVFTEPFLKVGVSYWLPQNMVTAPETASPDYILVNASAGTTLQLGKQKIALSIVGQNLLNTNYIDHLSRLKPDGILNIGRNITFSLRVPFQFNKK